MAVKMYLWRGYRIQKCRTCGLEFLEERPSESQLAAFYQDISQKKMVNSEIRAKKIDYSFGKYLENYSRHSSKTNPRFADVGGGVGYYAAAAQKHLSSVFLVDYADDALNFARDELQVKNVIRADAQNSHRALAPHSIDYLLFRHILEHVIDPIGCIQNLCKSLSTGGVLQIETPNVASYEHLIRPHIIVENFKILKSDNKAMSTLDLLYQAGRKSLSGINPPKHLWGFTPDSLTSLLRQCDMKILDVLCKPFGDPVFDPLYYDFHSLSNRNGLGKLYYYVEQLGTFAFKNSGSNLVVLAQHNQSS